MLEYYIAHPEQYKEKYGEELRGSDGKLSSNVSDNMYAEAAEAERKGLKTVRFYEEYSCPTSNSVNNRLTHYCEKKNAEVRIDDIGDHMSFDEIDKALGDGKTVVFGACDFRLEYENGDILNKDTEYEVLEGHEMTITGITSDGRYEVSTWGKKFYFDPENNASDMEMDGFYTIDYSQSNE